MRLSTSTSIMDRYQKAQGAVSMRDCILRCHKAGYRVLDMNCHDMSNPGMPLAQDDWEDWTREIHDLAQELDIEFSQSHAHFYNFLNPCIENGDWHDEMIRRSIIASGILGVKWMTMHASTETDTLGYSARRSKAGNMAYFPKYFDLAFQNNVGVVLENMYDAKPTQRTFTAAPDDLIDLVDSFQDERVQICWDFGHGNLVGIDQRVSLRQVGKRLKSTHIADNHGVRDEHLLPFYGDMDWESLMHTLVEIGYTGDFTYEITPFLDRVPVNARDGALKHTVEVGECLLNMAK